MKKFSLKENTKSNLFEEVSYKYFPYWPLFLCLLLVFIACGWTYLRYATPVYETKATLLIKDEKKGADENNLSESLNIVSAKKIVENELVVIQSKNLIDKVVKDLHLYAPVYEKGKFSDRSAYTSSPITIIAANPDQLQEVSGIAFAYNAAGKTVTINGQSYALNRPVSTPYGQLTFTQNRHFIKAAEKPLYFNLVDPKLVTSAVLKQLDVTAAGKLSSIVQLAFKDEVPRRGEDILNRLIDEYNTASVDYKNNIAKNTVAFLDDRLRVVEKELNNVERKIQNYKADKGIVDLSEQGKLYLQNVGDNDQRLAEINMQLAALGQVERYVSSKEKSAGIAPATLGVTDPMLSQLLDKLYQSELEYDRLKKTTGENNPMVEGVVSQIEKIRPSILENIRSQRNNLMATRGNLAGTNRGYTSMLQTIPQKERELIDVSRQQSIKNGIYSFLLQKREESAMAFASNLPDSKVVQAAQSDATPVSPNKPIVYLAAIALAFLFSIGLVHSKEMFSHKILFRSEIERNTDVPIVAEISNMDKVKGLTIKGKNNIIEEQFRQLRAATGLLKPKPGRKKMKKILVTSSIPGEGKSFVSMNLAINLSLSGKKVVLLDLDLRNPQSSKNFNISNDTGIGEFLESEMEPYEIIKSTEYNHLHVVPAGSATGNATELILSGRLKQLFDYLDDAFEYIIVDTSPVNPLADAYVLAEYCDLTLYIVRHKYTPKSYIKRLDETNQIKQLKNMAIVFNDIQPRGFINGNYGYGYGYGYEYGYNQKPKGTKRVNLKESFIKAFTSLKGYKLKPVPFRIKKV